MKREMLFKYASEHYSAEPKPQMPEILENAYADALIIAERETNIERNVFPATCPWRFEQVMNNNF